MRFSTLVPLSIALISLETDPVRGGRGALTNLDFEGCLRSAEESGEPQRGYIKKQKQNQRPQPKLFSEDETGHRPIFLPSKYNKANEPLYTIHPKNLNYEPPDIDTGFHSSQMVSSKELEDAVEKADRYTLNEWKEHADNLKELLDLVEQGPSLCDTPALGPPILDTQKRINHARDTVYHKLRYGTVRKTEDHKDSEATGEEE